MRTKRTITLKQKKEENEERENDNEENEEEDNEENEQRRTRRHSKITPSYVVPDSDIDEKEERRNRKKRNKVSISFSTSTSHSKNDNNTLNDSFELQPEDYSLKTKKKRGRKKGSGRRIGGDSLSSVGSREKDIEKDNNEDNEDEISSKRLRNKRQRLSENENNNHNDHQEENNNDEDEDDDNEETQYQHYTRSKNTDNVIPKKYKFRDRDHHQRTRLNVSHLGGKTYEPIDDNQSESDSDSQNSEENNNNRNKNRKSNNKNIRRNRSNDDERENEEEQDQEDDEDDEEDDDENDDDDEDEEEEEESSRKKYSFRDRSRLRRETLNVTHLGGDGQSYINKTKSRSGNRSSRLTYRDTTRLYLGGRIPVNNHKNEKSHHPSSSHYKKGRYEARNHYDSSSESSSSSDSKNNRGRSNNHRYSSIHDEELHFRQHEEERLKKELSSIVPLSFNGTQSSNNSTNGMGGSLKDKASKKDISRADVNPIAIDPSIGFESVGGLDSHIRSLKEMVVLPLLYPEVFQKFDTQPPRGVLFVGPPGTGKTLTARALANSLSTAGGPNSATIGGRKVSFFMRKGADCLSKWVGEGERQLRLLFEQAKLYEPSIIFFDEIDGLAPVRSIKQDQIHASIVSTLLALMDGLDSRGQVVVIGATNRPDAIDSALRRPGRFDRELLFPLPDANARRAILQIHTASWQPPLNNYLKEWIVESTSGYCGADMKALCSEAAIISLRRAYPQVYQSNIRLNIDSSTITVSRGDFAAALSRVIPASRRAATHTPIRSPHGIEKLLISRHVEIAFQKVKQLFPLADKIFEEQNNTSESSSQISIGKCQEEEWIATLTDLQDNHFSSSGIKKISSVVWDSSFGATKSCFMISGQRGMSHSDVSGSILQKLESFQLFNLEITSLISDGSYFSPEQALISKLIEARKVSPCVVYFPDILGWCKVASESMKTILLSLLHSFPTTLPILWISTLIWDDENTFFSEFNSSSILTSPTLTNNIITTNNNNNTNNNNDIDGVIEGGLDEKTYQLINWFSCNGLSNKEKNNSNLNIIQLTPPNREERFLFFNEFFDSLALLPLTYYEARKTFFEVRNQKLTISVAPVNTVNENSNGNIKNNSNSTGNLNINTTTSLLGLDIVSDNERDENYLREQRLFFWTALSELKREKKFASLIRPVDPEQVPDYYDVITSPMDLETMRSKVDANLYPTFKTFISDFEQIIFNAKEYNPLDARDARGRSIVSAAHHMLDIVKTHAYAFKERLGYDVFKRCEELYFRKHGTFPLINENRHIMPKENERYYREIFEYHLKLKKELEEEEQKKKERKKQHQNQNQTQTEESQNEEEKKKDELSVPSSVVSSLDLNQKQDVLTPSTRNKRHEADSSQSKYDLFVSCDEKELRKRARALKQLKQQQRQLQQQLKDTEDETKNDIEIGDENQKDIENFTTTTTTIETTHPIVLSTNIEIGDNLIESNSPEKMVISDPNIDITTNESKPVYFQSPIYDITTCPLANAYQEAIEQANQMKEQGLFNALLETTLNNTTNWSISDLITLYANLKRCTREFQLQGNWIKIIKDIENLLSISETTILSSSSSSSLSSSSLSTSTSTIQ